MPKVLDLNNLVIPTLDLTFADEARTTIHVTAPSEGLVSEMEGWVRSGLGPLAQGDRASVETAYDMTARLLSCNKECMSITATDLKDKYNVDLLSLVAVLKAYTEFISEIKNEKN
jgi:hypothetical protein